MGKITHNLRYSREYQTWARIKNRCYNKLASNYKYYGGAGIEMSIALKDSFLDFYNEIGPMPDYDNKWTVDRIDNDKGYIEGNIRWCSMQHQVRNKGMYSNNSSGVNGVGWLDRGENEGTSAFARWSVFDELIGKYTIKYKYFSVNKYGLLPSFATAVAYRVRKIAELNLLGYGYTDNHGK